MAAELPLPKQILAHAHWTMGKQKMSKSRGNVADPFQVLKDCGVDPVRYYLVRDGGLADDGGSFSEREKKKRKIPNDLIYCSLLDYSEDMIRTRYKKDLASQLGNLLNRSTAKTLLSDGIVPIKSDTLDARDEFMHKEISETAGKPKKRKEK